MGRRKMVRLPFVKTKIKSSTIYSIFSLLLFLAFVILGISFNQQATALVVLRNWMTDMFGRGAILFPLLFLFGSGMTIQSKKLRIVKPQWFIGYILFFSAYIALFKSGSLGDMLFLQTSLLISTPGAVVTYIVVLLISLLIAFELSIHDFLLAVVTFAKKTGKFAASLFSAKGKKTKQSLGSKQKADGFVGDVFPPKPVLKQRAPAATGTVQKSAPVQSQRFQSMATGISKDWKFPPLSLLDNPQNSNAKRGDVKRNSDAIEEALESFGVRARVVDINYGPAVTQYALQIAKGIKLNKITSLSNNLALALAAPNGQIRIEAPIPGKSLIGIEVPNIRPQLVSLKQMLRSPSFVDRSKPLLVPLGLNISGQPVTVEIDKMPHILVAGTTGSGKSVCLSSWIATILFRTTPDEVKLLLIDPKRVTFSMFDGIPNLLTNIITDPKDTISAFKWAVKHMEERYKNLQQAKTRDIYSYNEQATDLKERMPMIVIIIDELADLMTYASKEVENSITRLAQMARAVGIYLVLATQRPSVDVITGLMKANIPARVAFNVSSMIDSRVIIDMPGAEKLLGKGDMLFLPPDQSKPSRIQAPFISESEIKRLVDHFKQVAPVVHYTEEVTQQPIKSVTNSNGAVTIKSDDRDVLFDEAVRVVVKQKRASASLLQRFLSIGYSRAARIIDQLEAAGIVSQPKGSKPRDVLINSPDEPGNEQK